MRGYGWVRPEAGHENPGLLSRMQRFAAGMQVAVVVYVEYPATDLVVVTAMDSWSLAS
jgi:hypothetical protein